MSTNTITDQLAGASPGLHAPPGIPSQPPLRRTCRKTKPPAVYGFCADQPPLRRTCRKIKPPAVYGFCADVGMPHEIHRRHGRRRKSESTSQLASHEMETRGCNKVSLETSSRFIAATKRKSLHNDNKMGQKCCRSVSSPHPHLAQQAASMNQSVIHTAEHRIKETNGDSDCLLMDFTSSVIYFKMLPENILNFLKSIYAKHGDITRNCRLSDAMKSLALSRICEVVQDLQNKRADDLAIAGLDYYYTAVMDAEQLSMEVSWLRERLDYIRDALASAKEVNNLESERWALLDNVSEREEEVSEKMEEMSDKETMVSKLLDEIKKLKSECKHLADNAAQDRAMIRELSKKIDARSSKFKNFPYANLLDGLI